MIGGEREEQDEERDGDQAVFVALQACMHIQDIVFKTGKNLPEGIFPNKWKYMAHTNHW